MDQPPYPVGKLPAAALAELLARAPTTGADVVLGPGVGLDCAVVEHGGRLLVCKTDPITFVTDEPGRYLVRVNANDVATTGATPRWLLVTLLLPEGRTDRALATGIMDQIGDACRQLGIVLIGGHTEITYGLDRPVAVGCLLGDVERDRLVTPRGARTGDRLLLTKTVPVEGTALLAAELAGRLGAELSAAELDRARAYVDRPGISVVEDARIALDAGRVTAMHDPTEGGLLTALWELAEASGHGLRVDVPAVPVTELSRRISRVLGIDPLATIASGALLLTTPPEDSAAIVAALKEQDIPCTDIGEVGDGPPVVVRAGGTETLARPARDEVARLLEAQ